MYEVDGPDRPPVKCKDLAATEPLLAPTATHCIWYGVNSSAYMAALAIDMGGAASLMPNTALRGCRIMYCEES